MFLPQQKQYCQFGSAFPHPDHAQPWMGPDFPFLAIEWFAKSSLRPAKIPSPWPHRIPPMPNFHVCNNQHSHHFGHSELPAASGVPQENKVSRAFFFSLMGPWVTTTTDTIDPLTTALGSCIHDGGSEHGPFRIHV